MRPASRLIRRKPRAWTDAEGYKLPECPEFWPFGMLRPERRPPVRRVLRREHVSTLIDDVGESPL